MKVSKDLRYDDSAGSDPKLNSLDFYLPAGQAKCSTGFLRAWRRLARGRQSQLHNAGEYVRAEWALGLASVNYRLAPEVKHPGQIEDVAQGVRLGLQERRAV